MRNGWKTALVVLALLSAGIWLWHGSTRHGPVADHAPAPAPVTPGMPPVPQWGLGGTARATPPAPMPTRIAPADALPGEFVLACADAATMAEIEAWLRAAGYRIISRIPELGLLRVEGAPSWPVGLDPSSADLTYNFPVQLPPPPPAHLAGYLQPVGARLLAQLGLDSPAQVRDWGDGVRLAILDSGLGSLLAEQWNGAWLDLVDGLLLPADPHGHGTAVAALIASLDPQAPGLAPAVELLGIRVIDADGGGDTFTLAQGIVAAVRAGAAVINISLGTYSHSAVLEAAVRYAQRNDVLVVAAAGNDHFGRAAYPAAYPAVLGVTAVDGDGNRAPFANYGTGVDIAAPGWQLLTLADGGDYRFFNGTSAATPLVSAMAARLLAQNPHLSASDAAALLLLKADDAGPPGFDPYYGAGVLNAARIEQRATAGIVDLALADVYPDLSLAASGQSSLLITVENRGTTAVPGIVLDVSIDRSPYRFYFGQLDADAVHHAQIQVPLARLKAAEPLAVSATVFAAGARDSNPANDARNLTLQIVPTGSIQIVETGEDEPPH